jgi:hypothetical protein
VLHGTRIHQGSQRTCENSRETANLWVSKSRQAQAIYRTAEAVPFVQRRFFIQFFWLLPRGRSLYRMRRRGQKLSNTYAVPLVRQSHPKDFMRRPCW